MRRNREMSMLPQGMDGRAYNGMNGASQHGQRKIPGAARMASPDRLQSSHAVQRNGHGARTIRTVTPDNGLGDVYSVQTSPRSIQGGEKPKDRRLGQVFKDTDAGIPSEGTRSGPPISFHGRSRPRTRTMEEQSSQRPTASSMSKSRAASVHSTKSPSLHSMQPPRSVPEPSMLRESSSPTATSPPRLKKSNSVKNPRKLMRRSSRPASPIVDSPSLNSLPTPIATTDANKLLMLMQTLCGRMKGEVEYQAEDHGPWNSGTCYIDDLKGSLMFEGGDNGPFHVTVIPELRGCRVGPVSSTEKHVKYLELTQPAQGIQIRLLPAVEDEFDLWLAAFLCWQLIRPGAQSAGTPRPVTETRSNSRKRDSGFNQLQESGSSTEPNIIKVAKLLLWDKGAPLSPSALVKRPSTRELRSAPGRSWQRVSCILQDNGEFKLFTENDVTLLAVIQLSQLSRCAIQRLDRSVLNEKYSIAIFPQYTPTSTQLSIFRPVYIALESRIVFEVWFCLLRAFSIPEIYGSSPSHQGSDLEDGGILLENNSAARDMFRIEKSLNVRVVEAKFRRTDAAVKPDANLSGKVLKESVKLDQRDLSIGNYFAEVILDGEIRARTITKSDTRNPFWRQDCEFLDLPSYLPRLSIVLKRSESPEIGTHGFLSSSSVHVAGQPPREIACGMVHVPLEQLSLSKDSEAWWPILDEQQEKIGEMFLKLRHDELVVLLDKDYEPISEVLHHFTSGLTVQIAQSIPTSLRHLAETFVNIFQVSGHSGEWFKTLVEDEIDGIGKEIAVRQLPRWSRRIGSNESLASIDRELSVRDMGKSLQGEANLLFRGNSLLTQTFDYHMRRLGKEYLEDVLSENILDIILLNPECEVDPSRLARNEDIHKNWTLLLNLTTKVWESIADSADQCPPELRQVLKYIRAVAEDRYGDYLRTVSYTSVSGFLFLRFFCPALLNPKLFGLLRDHPQLKAQRTLTLIAKSLQALANLSTFGQKEEWMEPMNRFLGARRQAVKDYIEAICSTPSDKTTFSLPASYSTPITILGRLPPTSREGFPSLPYLIDQSRNFAALIKLWLEASSGVPPDHFEGVLATFNQLCIDVQRRTDECVLKAQNGRNADKLPQQWDDVTESLKSSTLNELAPGTESGSDSNAAWWKEYTASVAAGDHQRVPPGSAGSDLGSEERKERQSFWEATFGKDSKYQRPCQNEAADHNRPSSRGPSRNGNGKRSILSGLRRKGKNETLSESDTSFGPRPESLTNGYVT